MDVDDFEARGLRAECAVAEVTDEVVNLLDGELAGNSAAVLVPGLPLDAGRGDQIVTAHERRVAARLDDLQAGDGPVLLDGLCEDGHGADVVVAGQGQSDMVELGHAGVVHEHDAGSTVGSLSVRLEGGPAGRAVRVAQLGAHRHADRSVLDL